MIAKSYIDKLFEAKEEEYLIIRNQHGEVQRIRGPAQYRLNNCLESVMVNHLNFIACLEFYLSFIIRLKGFS